MFQEGEKMRRLERIPEVLEVLKKVWEKYPDLRLGQLIEDAGIGFMTEDDDAVKGLCKFGKLKPKKIKVFEKEPYHW
jgi:tRNA A37 methylthiotransferase MiaB